MKPLAKGELRRTSDKTITGGVLRVVAKYNAIPMSFGFLFEKCCKEERLFKETCGNNRRLLILVRDLVRHGIIQRSTFIYFSDLAFEAGIDDELRQLARKEGNK